MSSVKMTSELRQSELVFVELRQALLVWNNPETWMTLLVPKVKALVTKLDRRSQPKVVEQFSLEAVTCEGGMTPNELCQVLMEHSMIWKSILEIMTCYNAKAGDVNRTAAALKSAVVVFETTDLVKLHESKRIPQGVYFEIVNRAAGESMSRALLSIAGDESNALEEAQDNLRSWSWTLRFNATVGGDVSMGISYLAALPTVGEEAAMACQLNLLREAAKDVFTIQGNLDDLPSFWSSKQVKFVNAFCSEALTIGIDASKTPRFAAIQTLTRGCDVSLEEQQAALKTVQSGTCLLEKETRQRFAAQIIQCSHQLLEKRIRDRQNLRGLTLVKEEMLKLPDDATMEKMREPAADMKRVTDDIKHVVSMFKQVLARTSVEAQASKDFVSISDPITKTLTEYSSKVESAKRIRWNVAFVAAVDLALIAEDVVEVEKAFDDAIALGLCVDTTDLVFSGEAVEAVRAIDSARLDVSRAAKCIASLVLRHGGWDYASIPLTSEIDNFTKVALGQGVSGEVYTEGALQNWEALIETAIVAIDVYIQFSIASAMEGNVTYEVIRDALVETDAKKSTLHKVVNATQSPKHLEFDSSELRLLSNDILRHRVCDLLYRGGRGASVVLGQSAAEDAPLVRIDLRLALQFHRLGDAVKHIANIGHQVRASMSMTVVVKQFVKLVDVSVEFQDLVNIFDECCIALPDNASLVNLKDNTVAGVRQWVLDGARSEGHNGHSVFKI